MCYKTGQVYLLPTLSRAPEPAASIMRKLLAFLLLGLVGACGLAPHRIDVQQGNVITQDMVAKLKPGMTKPQVRFVLGTPLIVDIFHQDRWDYVYRFEKSGRLSESRKLTVVFEDEKLKRVEGDVVPAAAAAASGSGAASANP